MLNDLNVCYIFMVNVCYIHLHGSYGGTYLLLLFLPPLRKRWNFHAVMYKLEIGGWSVLCGETGSDRDVLNALYSFAHVDFGSTKFNAGIALNM